MYPKVASLFILCAEVINSIRCDDFECPAENFALLFAFSFRDGKFADEGYPVTIYRSFESRRNVCLLGVVSNCICVGSEDKVSPLEFGADER